MLRLPMWRNRLAAGALNLCLCSPGMEVCYFDKMYFHFPFCGCKNRNNSYFCKIMRRIAFYMILGPMYLLSFMPLKVHYFFSDIIAFLLHRVLKYRYGVVMTNIARSFPELNYAGVKDVAGKFYHHLADMVVESVWALSRSTDRIGRQIRFEGVEELNKACDLDRGVIVMLGHTGNWEIFTGLPDIRKAYGINIDNSNFNFIYKKQNSRLSDMLIGYIRNRHHACVTVESGDIIRHIIKNRDGRNAYFMICDQSPRGGKSDTVAEFLHQKTYMIEGPERIAVRMKMPVVYAGIRKTEDKVHIAHFKLIAEDASVCEKGWVTARYAELLEKDINDNRHQWLWSHKRWKRRIV